MYTLMVYHSDIALFVTSITILCGSVGATTTTAKGCEDWCGIDIVCVGDYVDKLFGDPDDCTKYYECAPLDLVHRECSPGLAFDCLRKRCDWDYLSVCQPPCPTTQKKETTLIDVTTRQTTTVHHITTERVDDIEKGSDLTWLWICLTFIIIIIIVLIVILIIYLCRKYKNNKVEPTITPKNETNTTIISDTETDSGIQHSVTLDTNSLSSNVDTDNYTVSSIDQRYHTASDIDTSAYRININYDNKELCSSGNDTASHTETSSEDDSHTKRKSKRNKSMLNTLRERKTNVRISETLESDVDANYSSAEFYKKMEEGRNSHNPHTTDPDDRSSSNNNTNCGNDDSDENRDSAPTSKRKRPRGQMLRDRKRRQQE